MIKLFARILLIVLFFALMALLFTGCYNRRTAIKKFCSQDTATAFITVRDTVIIDRITSDTIFATSVDSVVVEKDKLVIRYQKIKDKIYLSGQYLGDTIYKDKVVRVSLPCNCRNASSYSFSEWIGSRGPLYKWLLIFACIAAVVLLVWIFRK